MDKSRGAEKRANKICFCDRKVCNSNDVKLHITKCYEGGTHCTALNCTYPHGPNQHSKCQATRCLQHCNDNKSSLWLICHGICKNNDKVIKQRLNKHIHRSIDVSADPDTDTDTSDELMASQRRQRTNRYSKKSHRLIK